MDSITEDARCIINSAVELFTEQRQTSKETQFGFSWPACWNSNLADNDAVYGEVKRDFRVSQTVEEILRQMLSSATSAMEKLKGEFDTMTKKRVLHTLPDEIIAIILGHCCCSDDMGMDLYDIKNMLLVSRRFRSILLGIPSVWSHLNPLYIKTAKRFASYVTTPVITMEIWGAFGPSKRESRRVQEFYGLTASISSRIRRMALTLSTRDLPHLETILQACSSMSLPFLEDLSLGFSNVGHQCRFLCSNWEMPYLRNLEISGVIPELGPGILSQIQSCSVAANWERRVEGFEEEDWGTSEVVQFLVSLTSVKDLLLDVQLMDEYDGQEGLSMCSVDKLTLSLRTLYAAMKLNIMDIVRFPSISSFKLNLGIPSLERLEEVLESVSSSSIFRQSLTSIAHFTLSLGMEHGSSAKTPFQIINDWYEQLEYTKLEDLQSVTLESPRDKGHGLLSFTGSIDAVRVVRDEQVAIPENCISEIQCSWERFRRRKVAIFDSEFIVESFTLGDWAATVEEESEGFSM